VKGPFSGEVAEHYARFRRGYPAVIVEAIVERLGLTPEDVVVDLGCGTGLLALPLARHVRVVVGMDPEPDMLAIARRSAARNGQTNTTWLLGGDADIGVLGSLVRHCLDQFVRDRFRSEGAIRRFPGHRRIRGHRGRDRVQRGTGSRTCHRLDVLGDVAGRPSNGRAPGGLRSPCRAGFAERRAVRRDRAGGSADRSQALTHAPGVPSDN